MTRLDGTVFRYTNHDRQLVDVLVDKGSPLVFENFDPVGAPNTESWRWASGLEEASAKLTGSVLDSHFVADDARSGIWDDTKVEAFAIADWRYPFLPWFLRSTFWLDDVSWSGEQWEARLLGLTSRIDKLVGRVQNKHCDARELGDARCGYVMGTDPLDIVTTTVSAVSGFTDSDRRRVFRASGLTAADKFYLHGYVVWNTGANSTIGVNRWDVQRYKQSGGEVWLTHPTERDIQVGDSFTIRGGCNRSLIEHCKKRYANADNHRGFPYMPAIDKVIETPNASD